MRSKKASDITDVDDYSSTCSEGSMYEEENFCNKMIEKLLREQ